MLHSTISKNALLSPARDDAFATAPHAYSIDKLTKVTGVGRSKIFEEIRAGRLRAIKLGRRTLIRAEDMRRWLEDAPVIQPRAVT